MTQNVLYQANQNGKIIKKYLAICQDQLTKTLDVSGYISHDEDQIKITFTMEPYQQSKSYTTILNHYLWLKTLR